MGVISIDDFWHRLFQPSLSETSSACELKLIALSQDELSEGMTAATIVVLLSRWRKALNLQIVQKVENETQQQF